MRLIGPINTVLTLMDMLTPPIQEDWDTTGTSWIKYRVCATPNGSYNLGWSAIARSGLANTASIHGLTNSCLAGQSVPADGLFNPWNPAYVTNSYLSVAIGKTALVPGPTYRGQLQVSFYRPSGSNRLPYPTLVAAATAMALPRLPDTSWPITAYPDAFAPLSTPAFADAVPWALAPSRAKEDPDYERMHGLQPSRKPVEWSVAITSPGADAGGAGKPPRFHDYAPPDAPPKGQDKERKMRAGPALARALRYLGVVTEAADAVDALYKALPREYRPKWKHTKHEKRNVSYREKLQALYDHWDKVPLDDAVYNLAYETVMDRLYGEAGKVGGDISRRLGHHYGTGINSLQKRTHNLTRGVDFQ